MPASTARKRKKRGGNTGYRQVLPLLIVALVIAAAGIWYFFGGKDSGEDITIETRLVEMAAERGVGSDAIVADDPIQKIDGVFIRTWRFDFPNRAARDGFLGDLQIEGAGRQAKLTIPEELSSELVQLRMDFGAEAFDLQLAVIETKPRQAAAKPVPPTPVPTPTQRPEPAPDARGRLAILLDDGGQSFDLVPAGAALPPEVGYAILPFLPKSSETAVEMHRTGHEVWLHLPMEPQGYPKDDPGPGAVLIDMTPDELRTTVHTALNNVPHAVGVNNHMGSKVTADLKTMTWIMQELKVRDMAFIDSRTTVRTVAEDAARGQGVPTNRRHVFLDNERDPAAIRRQLTEAVYRCRLEGEAIAIGHLDEVTVRVLAEELPGISARGADLVKPSELVR